MTKNVIWKLSNAVLILKRSTKFGHWSEVKR